MLLCPEHSYNNFITCDRYVFFDAETFTITSKLLPRSFDYSVLLVNACWHLFSKWSSNVEVADELLYYRLYSTVVLYSTIPLRVKQITET